MKKSTIATDAELRQAVLELLADGEPALFPVLRSALAATHPPARRGEDRRVRLHRLLDQLVEEGLVEACRAPIPESLRLPDGPADARGYRLRRTT